MRHKNHCHSHAVQSFLEIKNRVNVVVFVVAKTISQTILRNAAKFPVFDPIQKIRVRLGYVDTSVVRTVLSMDPSQLRILD